METLYESYVDAVCMEILKYAEILSEYRIKTVYIGGGTPSILPANYIEKIMNTLKLFQSEFNGDTCNQEFEEVTIEVNPNSIDLEKLQIYQSCGINRISMGVQSTHNQILKNIGRVHTHQDTLTALQNIEKAGFQNISLDLIYPLPGLSKNMFKETLNEILTLQDRYPIKHISIYNLEVHENTKLDFLLKEKFLTLPDEEQEYQMKEMLEEMLSTAGFRKYEISNYAKDGFTSKHNLMYWNQKMYLGFGVSASSFFDGSRYTNESNLQKYINSVISHQTTIVQKEELDKLAHMKEYVILKLRLTDGILLSEFKQKFHISIFDLFQKEIDDCIQKGLVLFQGDRLVLSKRGMEVANYVWEKFI